MERAPGSRRFGISLLAFSPHRLAGAATYTVGLTQALVSRAPERYTVFVPRRYEPLWRELLPWPLDFVVCGPNPDRRILRVLFEQSILPRVATRRRIDTVFFPHLVAPGESLSSVAESDGLTVEELAGANGLSPEALLIAGNTLRIPSHTPSAQAAASGAWQACKE